MNKKIIGTPCLAIACTGAVVYSKHYVFNGSTSAESIMKDNVEALTDSETSPNNTGPAKLKNCAGHAGTTKFCMCENSNPCTESSCR